MTAANETTANESTGAIGVRTASWAPVVGPIAVAQALGAADFTLHGQYWNAPELPGFEPGRQPGVPQNVPLAKERLHLKKILGAEVSAPTWFEGLDTHLRGRNVNSRPGEKALDIREDILDHRPDAYLDVDDWLDAIGAAATAQNWPETDTDKVCAAAVKAYHIERQLTEDGLLPAGMRVWTYMAHDLAGAVFLVQAGFRLGFADAAFATGTLGTAAGNAANIFGSWAQFGASWVAAQSAFYGSYPSDAVWRGATRTVGLLLTDPQSPWTALPFPTNQPDAAPAGPLG